MGSIAATTVGALAGYPASRCMDAATGWFHGLQSEQSRRREEEVAPGGMLVTLGRQLAGVAGRTVDDATAGRIGLAVHRSLGVGYGVLASLLVRRGMRPLTAGVTVGAAAFLVVDEGTSLSTLTDFPLVSHARGVVGHATLALGIGVLLELAGGGRS